MTIKKGSVSKGKGKDVEKKNEVSKIKNENSNSTQKTSSSTDLAQKSSTFSTKHSSEMVSSSSVVQESKNMSESEKRTNTVETRSSSREVIMDSKGNVIKVIESKPKTVGKTSSTSRSAKVSQELIAGEQSHSLKERTELSQESGTDQARITDISRTNQSGTADQSRINQSRTTGHSSQTVQSSQSESFHMSSESSSQGSREPPKKSSKSVENCESKTIVTEGHTKDGQTVTSTIRINEAGQRIDDNGVVVSSTSQNIDSDIRVDKDDNDSARRVRPGDSTWNGKFIYEKPSPKGKSVEVIRSGQDDKLSNQNLQKSSVHDEQFSSSSSLKKSHTSEFVIKDQSTSYSKHLQSEDTTDFGRRDSTRSSHSPTRHTKPGDSTWDGRFVSEMQEPQKKRVFSDIRDSKHLDSTGSESTKVLNTKRFTLQEKDVIESNIRESDTQESNIHRSNKDSTSPTRNVNRPGESTWDGHFVYEKPQEKRTNDTTVVRTTEKRNDSVEVQDVTEEQNTNESVSSSYIIEYSSADDAKKVEKITSVSEVILEEDEGPGSPRRLAPRTYRPGESSWDGKFVYEKPFPDRKRPGDIRKVDRMAGTVDIREVTEDNSINEADISTSSYVIEHSSSEHSFKDLKNNSVSSLIINVDDHRDSSRRPESPSKTPKEKDVRTTKPGSSTWDGTFVTERSPESKKPRGSSPDRKPGSRSPNQKPESTYPDQKPEKKLEPLRKKNISDTTLDLREDDEVTRSSYIIQQSRTHESYSDSQNVDFSTTSVETVVIRDGHPVIPSTNITDDYPIKYITETVIDTDYKQETDQRKSTDKKQSTDHGRPTSPEKRGPTPEERSVRPTKPGSSTWDGSFVYEKPDQPKKSEPRTSGPRKPEDLKTDKPTDTKSKSVDIRKHSTDITDQSTTSRIDFSESSTSMVVEKSSIIDSKTFDSTDISRTIKSDYPENIKLIDDGREPMKPTAKSQPKPSQRPGDSKSPEGRKSPEKSSIDRSVRPTKPGSSTWDGSFVYESPQGNKPTDDKKPSDEKKPSILKKPEDRKHPKDSKPSDSERKPSTRKEIVSTTVKHDVIDSRDIISDTDVTVTSEVVQQSYVLEKSSSFTEVQDFRNVVEDRVISEFTKDIRQDEVS